MQHNLRAVFCSLESGCNTKKKKKTVPHRSRDSRRTEKGTAEASGWDQTPGQCQRSRVEGRPCRRLVAGKIITDNNKKDVPLVEFMFWPCIYTYAR